MQAFCSGRIVDATHPDWVSVPADAYPDRVLYILPDTFVFERIGDPPGEVGAPDARPYALPDIDLSAYAPPPPDLSKRQFAEGLWHDGLISFSDYLAFVGPGTIPGPLLAIINELADDETGQPTPRKLALGTITGATTYRFNDPLVESVRASFEAINPIWTVAHLRARWTVWATL